MQSNSSGVRTAPSVDGRHCTRRVRDGRIIGMQFSTFMWVSTTFCLMHSVAFLQKVRGGGAVMPFVTICEQAGLRNKRFKFDIIRGHSIAV